MRGRITFCVTIKNVLIHSDLMTNCVAQYCCPDLYVPVLDKNNHVQDSFTDGLRELSTAFEMSLGYYDKESERGNRASQYIHTDNTELSRGNLLTH